MRGILEPSVRKVVFETKTEGEGVRDDYQRRFIRNLNACAVGWSAIALFQWLWVEAGSAEGCRIKRTSVKELSADFRAGNLYMLLDELQRAGLILVRKYDPKFRGPNLRVRGDMQITVYWPTGRPVDPRIVANRRIKDDRIRAGQRLFDFMDEDFSKNEIPETNVEIRGKVESDVKSAPKNDGKSDFSKNEIAESPDNPRNPRNTAQKPPIFPRKTIEKTDFSIKAVMSRYPSLFPETTPEPTEPEIVPENRCTEADFSEPTRKTADSEPLPVSRAVSRKVACELAREQRRRIVHETKNKSSVIYNYNYNNSNSKDSLKESLELKITTIAQITDEILRRIPFRPNEWYVARTLAAACYEKIVSEADLEGLCERAGKTDNPSKYVNGFVKSRLGGRYESFKAEAKQAWREREKE